MEKVRIINIMKICGCCKLEKENSEFGINRQRTDGLRFECRECRKKNYYINHEKMLEEKRLDYEKHRESRLAKDKLRYSQNKNKFIKRRKQYYENNKEKALLQCKKYREENRDEILRKKREYEQNRRNQKKAEKEFLESQIITVKYPNTHKQCSRCHALKEINTENFNLVKGKNVNKVRYRSFCRDCGLLSNKVYHLENGDKIREQQREYYKNNPEIVKATAKRHRKSEAFRVRHALPKNRIIRNMTQYIRFALSQEGLKKDGRATMKYVGCTREFFRNYIQSQWKEGMSWENYGNGPGEWSVDHFLPKEAFNLLNQEEQDICFNWKNCQPMWHLENESKQDKMPDGSFARETKDNYSLNDKILMINNRAQSLNLPNL